MAERVEALTHHGYGRLTSGDLVRGVLPGELIDAQDTGRPRIIEPSTDRVAPPCRHAKFCGGCSVMHASDPFVANWKTEIIRNALAARKIETEICDIYTSPAQSRRRAKFSGRRTKKGATVGFHAAGSDTISEVRDCQLVVPEMLVVLPAMEELTKLGASRKSEVQITVIQSNAGADVWVQAEKPLDDALRVELANIGQSHRLARLSWNEETVVTLQSPEVAFGSAYVIPPHGAFLQATADAERVMVSAVQKAVGSVKSIVDLFSGCGTFTFPMAAHADVHAVEGDQSLLESLDKGWRQSSGLKHVTTECRDLFRRPLEPDELRQFDAAIVDPPRAGAEAQIKCLIRTRIPNIAMVSCNPVTFARDAQTLIESGFALDWILPIDQFRWSSHVELVGSFTRL